ncbi:AraC family ligand binding domain-containing protein [Mammaliicoccus sciuri]|uniref:AraC family ligand binding domain-containing protein n=2 Tax=Mammaliicoccus sciuri TaxID=1296 RepID=UPI001F3DFCE2|nr:AraC family ligand binding domain-containing protein [Mammaliicoccus sciuri]
MDNFLYKKRIGVTALLAQMSEFKYKKHAHKEYALGVTLDGAEYLSYPNNVMFYNPEQIHDGSSFDKKDLKYTMVYLEREHILGNDNIPQNVIFNKPISNDQNLKNIIIHLSNAILTNQEDAYILEQLLQVNDALLNNDINVAPKDNRLINMAKNIIESHLFDTLNVEMISLELNMT